MNLGNLLQYEPVKGSSACAQALWAHGEQAAVSELYEVETGLYVEVATMTS